MVVVLGSEWRAATWTSRNGTPASSAAMMKAAPRHVGMDDPEACLLSDRPHPRMSSTSVEAIPVPTPKNRAVRTLTDDQVQGPSRSRDERHQAWLVAFAKDPERPMPVIEGDVLDVRRTRFAHAQSVEPEQNREGRMIVVETFCRAEERPELPSVEPSAL
jgi:hypothetical protein